VPRDGEFGSCRFRRSCCLIHSYRIVPNYELAPDLEKIEILRVVVRENVSEVLVDQLVGDLMEITENLVEKESSAHTLSSLGSHLKHEQKEGKLDHGSGSEPSGTYAKTC